MTRIRTLNFLPEIFQTSTNRQFLGATLDQIVNPPVTKRIQGYIGSKFGYGVNSNDYYVTEPTKVRTDYQLDPGVVFTKPNESIAQDFISYPGILDALKEAGALVDNNNRLFESQIYSWDSFTDLDKIINYHQYYWAPDGLPAVTVSAGVVFLETSYIVTDFTNGYNIRPASSSSGSINPTLTLLRGGTYTFTVNQDTNFWIQGEPGISGYSPITPNQYVRDVYGVVNNGASQGQIIFNVPTKDAQDQYNFASTINVDVVSDIPFENVNGMPVSALGGIDGVTSLEGLTVMFYNTGVSNETGYVSTFFDQSQYDTNGNIVAPLTVSVIQTNATGNLITCSSTANLSIDNSVTFTGIPFGGLATDTIYYVTSIVNATQFTVSTSIGGTDLGLTTATGSMTANINQGLYEEGEYSTVNDYFYLITYIGDPSDPVIQLIPTTAVPTETKIIPLYGAEYIGVGFYKDSITGVIAMLPYITAPLDTLYYQDGTSPNKVGVIRIIDNNVTNTIDVENDILGRKTYTSPNGVKFTNGLKVIFDGDVIPRSYLDGEYYVQGVGTAIELISVSELIVPEAFTTSTTLPYDSTPYDIGNYDNALNLPTDPDYITIARNAINRNAWSRSNRWFHIDAINATAQYNNSPEVATLYATKSAKAKRPIIEFYPNLRLFNAGTLGKSPVDFIDTVTTDALSLVAGKKCFYPDVQVYTTYSATLNGVVAGTSTTITVDAEDVIGPIAVNQFINDSDALLPTDAVITSITGTTTLTITVSWANPTTFATTSNLRMVANDISNINYSLFTGSRIIFAADSTAEVRNKIYLVEFAVLVEGQDPVITLTEAYDSDVQADNQAVITRGYNYQGETFYYNGLEWKEGQQKITVNQTPYFDVFDANGVSFGNEEVYLGTSFSGCTLFSYGIGDGPDDPVLSFPIRYSSINNIGDISFDVTLNIDTFDHVSGATPITTPVKTGYVYNYTTRTDYIRQIGWQTAIAPSTQYQIFEFDYIASEQTNTFVCDVQMLSEPNPNDLAWPTIQVYINNVLQATTDYTYTITPTTTIVTLNVDSLVDTKIQILLLSDQVSYKAYYSIPINLNNNPFNTDITTANIGDIRSQYQSIFTNSPETEGDMFGANNYHDLGNLVPYGTKIIQNSASLVLPAVFLRKQNHNLFDSLLFNSREYIKFKTLLVDVVNNTSYVQRYNPSVILDDALEQISSTKSEEQPFFWSDMLPSKAVFVTNTYTFQNSLDTSIYPLSRVYDFTTANYYGVLVYLQRTISGNPITKQLLKDVDYTVSSTNPSLTITLDLLPNDIITIKEYNQTYGSYVPNTPSKLGLYPSFIPEVVLDTAYTQPTYFIKGHDGSYNKLYGDYNPVTGVLTDFRDQALFEFECRIYNNLKLSNEIFLEDYEILPGFFRDTDYSYDEILQIYSSAFLNWVGQNRLNYQTQFYNANNQYTYNYSDSANKLNKQPLSIGYWRGLYEYFFDTSTPNTTPWEMIGYANKPTWWETRYGPAPYTSDNLVLWNDMAAGIDWNNGDPVVIPSAVRDGLLQILPVDEAGDLISPLLSVVGNYNSNIFQRDWVVGDVGPVEFSYRRSSSWPFDLMRIYALTKPAKFFNLGADIDNYKFNTEFNQYLVNNRSHLVPSNIEIYGSGTPKTSYINWIVDYQKQIGVDATQNIKDLLFNLDVRLVYRLAGYSDKSLLKFYVEKGTPNSTNSSLLIPDESYAVLLYDNQPYDRLVYSSVVVQLTNQGYTVYGNSQTNAYFKVLQPVVNGKTTTTSVEELTVKTLNDYSEQEVIVPYGTLFYTPQELSQFLISYGKWLESKGAIFNDQSFGLELNWLTMIAEFLYWAQLGWEVGSVITLNPAALSIKIDKESQIVQPLTIQQTNFILNQNLYPIQSSDLSVVRDGTYFSATPLNEKDTVAYAQFNLSNFEHGIVFNNITLFNDVVYNLVTGLRQTRITVRGTKTAEWNGTVMASGFIYNQDNVKEWQKELKYTKGSIVKYKNRYWTALTIVQPSQKFNENEWKYTEYDDIQKGLLANPSTRSYESALYYNVDKANLESDADLLSFSLIGYRPRDYLALADLTDITQINVYKNMIKSKGTRNSIDAFKGANLPQGGIDYDVYENWAIKSGEFGGVLNSNFVEFRLNQNYLTANPSIVSLTNGIYTPGSQQEIPLYSLFNYSTPITNPNVLPTVSEYLPSTLYPTAGYVNFNDVKMSAYYAAQLGVAVNKEGIIVPIQDFYVRDYVWLANYLNKWQVFTPESIGQVTNVKNNLNGTATVTFKEPHGLTKYQLFAIVNFDTVVDNYYIAITIVNPYQVIINLTFNANTREITGEGIGLKFQSQRVDTPADISNLPLLNSEFTKNTVWVDTNNDGGWAVYRKGLNYQFSQETTKENSSAFGSAVSYDRELGYLVSDALLGEAYRYTFNDLLNEYVLIQTITGSDISFGQTIAHKQNVYVISQPTSTPEVYIYIINNSAISDDLLLYQAAIAAPMGVTNWGSALALSGDTNWLYISDIDNNLVHVYRKDNINLDAGYLVIGETYIITNVGDTDFTLLGAVENKIGITFVATGAGTIGETGQVTQVTYKDTGSPIDASGFLTAGDNFGYSIATDYYGDTIVIGAPNVDYSVTIARRGNAYVYQRSEQKFESQYNSTAPQRFTLSWAPATETRACTITNASNGVEFTGASLASYVDYPVIFTGIGFGSSLLQADTVYYINSYSAAPNTITLKNSRSSSTVVTLAAETLTADLYVQSTPLYVYVNGTLVDDSNYAIIGSELVYTGSLNAGDIITVSGGDFTLVQTLSSSNTPRTGVQFGIGLDTTRQGSEILIGAPFELSSSNQEGAVYRFTNGGGKYGQIIGTSEVNVTTNRTIILNGYAVTITPGNATNAASIINAANITNVQAAATTDNKLIIQVVDINLTQVNEKLLLSVLDATALTELGITIYTETQTVLCPHAQGPTQFGTLVKFNELDSFVVSAPVGTRYASTTFDFTDDENLDNDTVFDNNSTQFIESYSNAGAVYMYDYLSVYEESLNNIGKFVYAQSLNARNQTYNDKPFYGEALDFSEYGVVIGAPDYSSVNTEGCVATQGDIGQVVTYTNPTGIKDWSVYRQTSAIVDTDRVQNIQIFSAETNNTLDNLDYFDPLQGKILGAIRQNIDVVSNVDPAGYTSTAGQVVWGTTKIGTIWFDTTNVRFVNYHQNDVVYNATYWGTLFPGSDVAIYSWIESAVPPVQYQGPGVPYDVSLYTTQYVLNASNEAVAVYCYWVRNTNIVFTKRGKTLADTIISSYISNPKNSGITYFAPILPNTFALYNAQQYINATDSVLHVGYSNGESGDVPHSEYTLIRANYPDDFLPGVPGSQQSTHPLLHGTYTLTGTGAPRSLYDRFLDSLAGVDEAGAVVPNPYLPKAVQSGILARPRQSFFYSRYGALKNYLIYANEVLKQFPIAEMRRSTYLFAEGEFYNTPDYWEYVNWWAPGYDDRTKSALQVPLYADLAALSVANGTIVTVAANGEGKSETYRYDDTGVWTRIGLQAGTIQFKTYLWDYEEARLGFGDNFFDTSTYDMYPSEETRWIIRALNEQIYTNELLIYRNKSLVLLFEYIQSETIESQNYLPWLNKTSLVDVGHTIRELRPIEVFQSDNQDFLAGYLNEVKPYHVVIKEFLFKYTGTDVFEGNITDFDLPAQYNTSVQQFITPQLVYNNPNTSSKYLPDNSIWQTSAYNQWFENQGVSVTGQPEFLIGTLASYVTLGSNSLMVDNVFGYPINGTILIGTELIGYSGVDLSTNTLTGLIRGVNGTTIAAHIPGDNIYIDLPPVVLLNGGRSYANPPRVRAVIDTTIYPEPTQEAVLEAVMSLDSVLSITVIDPGKGYATIPEIVIDPALSVYFSNTSVNTMFNTIQLYAPELTTGDLVKYTISAEDTRVAGLEVNQWYYVNLLETVPTSVIALYENYADAINDRDRITLISAGSGTLSLGAKAYAITTSAPVRENNITLRFDRTTYDSQVVDWEEGRFYGAFFAGGYTNEESISSSSLLLDNALPSIESIYASAQGVVLEIENIRNDREVIWSSFIRYVQETVSGSAVRLLVNNTNPNASGSTIGFTVGMPVKFVGAVGTTGLVDNTVYYIASIIDNTDFTLEDENGTPIVLTPAVIGAAGLECYVAQIVDTAILTVNYPGLRTATNTTAGSNTITIPMTAIGTGGTSGFYVNMPLFFVGNVFGNIIENEVYYVTTVCDSERFTISESTDPLIIEVTDTTTGTNLITLETTVGLNVNDPVIFTGNIFGGIVAGTTYYVREIASLTEIQISETINGSAFALTTASGTAAVTSQINIVQLSTAVGSMTTNISLPVSPGQINGQLFTLYNTSGHYPNITAYTIDNLISVDASATIATVNRIALPAVNTLNMYVNMPFEVNVNVGGLTTGTTYYIIEIGQIQISVTNTLAGSDELVCTSTDSLYVDMPIIFSGSGIGGIIISDQYYVSSITSSTNFTVSATVGGPNVDLTTASGVMIGTGDAFLRVSTTPGGSEVVLSSTTTPFVISQTPLVSPVFDVSYILGGYRTIILTAGQGFALENTFTISGALIGGTSPENDLTLEVNSIGTNGEIINVICSGTVPGISNNYYLKVLSATELAVYSNPLMTVPVSGVTIPYNGFIEATVTAIDSITDAFTIADTSIFNLYDAVVFTTIVTNNIDGVLPNELEEGTTYYISAILNGTQFQISEEPGGATFDITTLTLVNNFRVASIGSMAFLPEPFYFNQSIVKYNNRVYVCVVSNNDSEFIFGKWELLTSGDRRLNALDRIIGYYQPTDNMPGVDLTQLVANITYPNSTYLGNAFEPAQQYALDTVLIDQPFYPTGVDLTAITHDGTYYVAPANLPEYTALAIDDAGNQWDLRKLANSSLQVSDISYANGLYIMTSQNASTPIFKSVDRNVWTVNGYFTTNLTLPWSTSTLGMTSLSSVGLILNSVDYGNGIWVAVGNKIVLSDDGYIWRQTYSPNPILNYNLYNVARIDIPAFTGFIAVGKGKRYDYSTGVTLLVDTDVILTLPDGSFNWSEISTLTTKGLYAIASDGTQIVVSGQDGVIYNSLNGLNWFGVNEAQVLSIDGATDVLNVTSTQGLVLNDVVRFNKAFDVLSTGTDYYVVNILSPTQLQIATGPTPTPPIDLSGTGSIPEQTLMYIYPFTETIRDMIYSESIFMTIGDSGEIRTSSDGITWTTQTSGTVENLKGMTYLSEPAANTWTVVGDNNTVLQSTDVGVTWTATSTFEIANPDYNVIGDPFTSGYGPEELVPGVITDQLMMIVTTRPGTTWPASTYAHVGYNVVSLELTPEFELQTEYSFYDAVQTPAQVSVFEIDYTTGLSTTLYDTLDYTIDWPNFKVILTNPLTFTPPNRLRIDVYEVGNGNQLVKSNTESDPIRINEVTGFNEIYLSCNYSATEFNGSGVIRGGTFPLEVEATATSSTTNAITVDDPSKFVLNDPITFSGATFGGILEDTTYFVKSISFITSSIIVSTSYNFISGTAGPTFELTTATGSMQAIIQQGSGLVWSDPSIFWNGAKLLRGEISNVTRTKSVSNSVVCNSTANFIVDTPVVFSDTIFGGVISPQTVYYISSIIDGNEFTISATIGGAVIPLTDATGGAILVTNDYAFDIVENAVTAKIVFADQYDATNDYITYTVFGETNPVQYGYTLPETQLITSTGAFSYTLNNYVGDDNPDNAVVEINGVRVPCADYTISSVTDTITFVTAPTLGDSIAVTTFNDTNRQYLITQCGITGSAGSLLSGTVGSTTNVSISFDTVVTAGGFEIGIEYVIQTIGTTDFTLIGAASNTIGLAFIATGPGTGTGTAAVGFDGSSYDESYNYLTLSSGTTAGYTINSAIVFSAPTLGGIVAGTTYYITEIWSSTEFVISATLGGSPFVVYDDTGAMPINIVPLVVANITNIDNSLSAPLAVICTASTTGTNRITCADTTGFVVGQTVIFKGVSFGGIATDGTVYFVDSVPSGTQFTIKDQNGNQIALTTATGAVYAYVGGLTAVRVTTGITHEFAENDLIQIDGVVGSIQLNNNTYYAKIITDYQFDLYTEPYDPTYGAVNSPVTSVSTYVSGGYVWLYGLFRLKTVDITDTTATVNEITAISTLALVEGTPIYFTEPGTALGSTIMGGIIAGQEYFVLDIVSSTAFTISETRDGPEFILSTDSGYIYATQWNQTNVDRLWVTVNGYRVPSSSLRLGDVNNLSILTTIVPGDDVTVTSMIPSATPNEDIYLNRVSTTNEGEVYRANPETRTWLTQTLYELDPVIYVYDATRVTNVVVENRLTPAPVSGVIVIGVTVDKNLVTNVTIYNNTTSATIASENYQLVVEPTGPQIEITPGAYITTGDSLTITILVGNEIYINGELIRFQEVDLINNTLSGLQRGYDGTGTQTIIPEYSEVYSLLSDNRMSDPNYNLTWNSNILDTTLGDPLQASNTSAANFLKVDIT